MQCSALAMRWRCDAHLQVTQNKQEFAQGRVFFTAFTDACKEKKYRDMYGYSIAERGCSDRADQPSLRAPERTHAHV